MLRSQHEELFLMILRLESQKMIFKRGIPEYINEAHSKHPQYTRIRSVTSVKEIFVRKLQYTVSFLGINTLHQFIETSSYKELFRCPIMRHQYLVVDMSILPLRSVFHYWHVKDCMTTVSLMKIRNPATCLQLWLKFCLCVFTKRKTYVSLVADKHTTLHEDETKMLEKLAITREVRKLLVHLIIFTVMNMI